MRLNSGFDTMFTIFPLIEYGIFERKGLISHILSNQKGENSAFSLLIGWKLRPFPENNLLYSSRCDQYLYLSISNDNLKSTPYSETYLSVTTSRLWQDRMSVAGNTLHWLEDLIITIIDDELLILVSMFCF